MRKPLTSSTPGRGGYMDAAEWAGLLEGAVDRLSDRVLALRAERDRFRAALEGCVEAGKAVEHFCVRVVGDPDHGCELCKALAAARAVLGGKP